MVERNYRVFCSMNNIPLEEGTVDEDEDEDMEIDENVPPSAGDEDAGEWGGIMEVDGAETQEHAAGTPSFFEGLKQASSEMPKTKSKRKKTKVAALVREKIRKVLEETELADQRSGKCTENDFLRLLHAFNTEGLHFS